MLKERDVLDALPSQGFLREYVHFAMSCTDAHAAYHLACGLIGLSQAVPPSYLIPFASPIYSNMFTMVVGDSSRSRKTTAINIIQNMLREAIPGSVGETPGSTEGVSESLRANPRQVIIYGEFGEFLAKAENGYLMPLKTAYTSAWDCMNEKTEILTEKGWKKRGEVQIGDMVYSMNLQTEKLELVPALDVGERPVAPGEKMVVVQSANTNIRTTEGHRYYWRVADGDLMGTTGREWAEVEGQTLLPTTEVDSAVSGSVKVSPVSYMAVCNTDTKLVDPEPGEIVWCVTNQNGTLVTRYEGRVAILGNCSPMGRATANSRRGMVTDPRLSLLCGVATDLLERHTEQADWTGGFLARFLTFHAEPERVLASMPIPNRQQKDQLTHWLRQLADPMIIPGQCDWLDAPERLVWDQWWASMKPMRDSANRRAQAACARAGALAQKVALLLAWDLGEGRSGRDFYVGREAVESAIKITNLHIQSVLELGERVTGNKDMRDRAMVLRAIGDKLVPLGVIIKNTDMLKKRIKDVVESLLEERSIEAVASGNLVFYRQTPESHQRLVQIADQVTQASNSGELGDLGLDGTQQVAKVIPMLPRTTVDPTFADGPDSTSVDDDEDLAYYDSLPM